MIYKHVSVQDNTRGMAQRAINQTGCAVCGETEVEATQRPSLAAVSLSALFSRSCSDKPHTTQPFAAPTHNVLIFYRPVQV